MEETRMIEVAKIHLDPNQPREIYDGIEQLAEAMKNKGFDQAFAITVEPHPDQETAADGFFQVIMGHRRTKSALLAGIAEIPCLVKEGLSRTAVYELQLQENENRKDLKPMERVRALQKGIDRGISDDRMAKFLGVSLSTIKSDLELITLTKELHKFVDDGKLPIPVAKKIATSFTSASEQLWVYNNVVRYKKTAGAMLSAIEAKMNKDAQVNIFADAKKAAGENGGILKNRKATVQLEKVVGEFEKKGYHRDPNTVTARKNEIPTLKQLVASLGRISKDMNALIEAHEAQVAQDAPRRAVNG